MGQEWSTLSHLSVSNCIPRESNYRHERRLSSPHLCIRSSVPFDWKVPRAHILRRNPWRLIKFSNYGRKTSARKHQRCPNTFHPHVPGSCSRTILVNDEGLLKSSNIPFIFAAVNKISCASAPSRDCSYQWLTNYSYICQQLDGLSGWIQVTWW